MSDPSSAARKARKALAAAGGIVHRGEIARRLDPPVTLQRAHVLTSEDGFPEPVAVLGTRPVWIAADVAAWAAARGRTWTD